VTLKIPAGLTHATGVAINGLGLLITGPSGSGKSGLALQLMALGATLVSDDQVMLSQSAGIVMSPPKTLAGKIEARFLGILECSFASSVPLSLVVALESAALERMPQPQQILVGSTQIDLINGANVPNLASALMVRFSGM